MDEKTPNWIGCNKMTTISKKVVKTIRRKSGIYKIYKRVFSDKSYTYDIGYGKRYIDEADTIKEAIKKIGIYNKKFKKLRDV